MLINTQLALIKKEKIKTKNPRPEKEKQRRRQTYDTLGLIQWLVVSIY